MSHQAIIHQGVSGACITLFICMIVFFNLHYILYHMNAGTCGYSCVYIYTEITHYSRIAVPSSVVTVTLYPSEAGKVALRKTMTDVLSSDTLYSIGSMSTIIAAEVEETVRRLKLGLDKCAFVL